MQGHFKTIVPVISLQEGKTFICYSPAFDLVTHGDSIEDAEMSFDSALQLFVEEVTRMGTWDDVFAECGWQKEMGQWIPPRVISQKSSEVELPVVQI